MWKRFGEEIRNNISVILDPVVTAFSEQRQNQAFVVISISLMIWK